MIETYRGIVYQSQVDHMDHMNIQYYTSKFDEAIWHLFSKLGITTGYIGENKRGMAAVEQTIKYKSEAVAGDLLVIKSRVIEMKEKVIRFEHIMYTAETNVELAVADQIGVHIDRQRRESCPFPPHILQRGIELSKKE